jgi:mannose-binding lectin 2
VSTDINNENTWKECFTSNIKLPTGYYFGFSAATGELSGKYLYIVVDTPNFAPTGSEG